MRDDVGCPLIEPNDSVVKGLACDFVEGHGGLALVGDADGFDIQVVALLNLNKTLHNVIIDLLRVMLDPSWLLRYLLVLPCGNVKHF